MFFYSKTVSANGLNSGLHDYKNPLAPNIIFDSYSITPPNKYFPYNFYHAYNLYEQIINFDSFCYCILKRPHIFMNSVKLFWFTQLWSNIGHPFFVVENYDKNKIH